MLYGGSLVFFGAFDAEVERDINVIMCHMYTFNVMYSK